MKSIHCKSKKFSITKFTGDTHSEIEDAVAAEEPMEIRLVFGPADKRTMRSISVTMRTPGNDSELAAGFLFTEGILTDRLQIESIEFRGVDDSGKSTENIVRVNLQPEVVVDFNQLQRNFLATSSCGVCGKSSLESLDVKGIKPLTVSRPTVDFATIYKLPELLRQSQPTFDQTGGIHAACFTDSTGRVFDTREDIGRHNAVDKLIGLFFQKAKLPASDLIMVVSGRAGFEIVQKAIVARVPIMVAVGAPSSLAVDLARKFNMTLVGFANEKKFNVYSAAERIT